MPTISNRSGAAIAWILSACVIAVALKLALRTLSNPSAANSTVVVTSTPAGASVFWNEEDVGETGLNPVRIFDVSPGRHLLRVEKRGYVKYEKAVNVLNKSTSVFGRDFWRSSLEDLAYYLHDPREVQSKHARGGLAYNVTLTPLKPGSITIKSEPAGAKIYVEGELKGETPVENLQLIPGTYRLRIQKDDYSPWLGEVRIESSKHKEVNRRLKAGQFVFYKDEIAKDPDNLLNYIEFAKWYLAKGEIEDGKRMLSKAFKVASKPMHRGRDLKRFLRAIGRIYSGESHFGGEGALQKVRPAIEGELENVIASQPQTPFYYYVLAKFYEMSEQPDKLVALYEKAIKSLPRETEMHLRLAEFYLDRDEAQKALDLVEKIKAKKTNKAMARYISALANMKLGKKGRAKIDLKIASFYIGARDEELKQKIDAALKQLESEK